jgi:hypothetical protein
MVNPRAKRTSIGLMLNARFSPHQLRAQATNLPPQCPQTQDWLRRNPLKRQRSPDREKAKTAPHSHSNIVRRTGNDDAVRGMIFKNDETIGIGLPRNTFGRIKRSRLGKSAVRPSPAADRLRRLHKRSIVLEPPDARFRQPSQGARQGVAR